MVVRVVTAVNLRRFGIFIWSIYFQSNLVPWSHWWLHLIRWWCWAIWSTHIASRTIFKPSLESIRSFLLFWYFRFTGQYYFQIISFPFDQILHSKMVSYQFEYAVQDKVGGDTIVMYFHTAMVNKKKQYFWLFLLVVCVVNYLSCVSYAVRWSLIREKNWKIFFVVDLAQTRQKITVVCLFTRPFLPLRSLCYF